MSDALPAWANPEREVVTGELVGAIDPQTWANFIGLVADGHSVPTAIERTGVTRYALNGLVRTNTKARAEYDDAKLAAVRRNWDMETVEEVLNKLMLCEHGGHLNRILDDMGLDASSFYRLIHRDPLIRDMYDEARQIQAEAMGDLIRQIADDGTNDTYVDGRGNVRVDQDVMGRSRIRVDTYKWVMSKLHYKRFGDKQQVDQTIDLKVDHAAALKSGQRRLEKLAAERAK